MSLSKRLKAAGYKGPHPMADWKTAAERVPAVESEPAMHRPLPGQMSFLDEPEPRPLTFGSLFAGIGGFDLGLERAGLVCRWQVEIDPFCRRVLAKHWPDVRRHDDVRTFPPADPAEWAVDVICGGFPCQGISKLGKGAGLEGERSGLWYEFARVVRDLRPRYVLVENVPALLTRGLHIVLGQLASLGYDAEWHCLSAADLGAPHIRERVFVLGLLADAHRPRQPQSQGGFSKGGKWLGYGGEELRGAYSAREGFAQWGDDPANKPKSPMARMANGIPNGLDLIRALGNAVVPQVAEFLGRRLVEFHAAQAAQEGGVR